MDSETLLARAYLSRVGEPAHVDLWAFVRERGPIEAVAALRRGAAPSEVLTATAARRDTIDPAADLEVADRRGIRLIGPESDEWPHFALSALEVTGARRLRERSDGDTKRDLSGEPIPPLALWVRGPLDLRTLGTHSAGLVGSRSATDYGTSVTADLAFGLARRGITVVSGGAYGIDAASHRAALAAEGTTVAVSAGGLDRPYPTGNASLFERIAEAGLLVSESPPGCAPQRHRFLSRNRLIAAFSTGVVVVEAAGRSGALNTATHAERQGRSVMAVPGQISSHLSVGCHDLIRRRAAVLVTSVEEVLAEVGPMGAGRTPDVRPPTAPVSDVRVELDGLDPLSRRVFEGLGARRFAPPEAIAHRSGVDVLEVVRALPTLDLAGLVESSDAGYRLAERFRPARGP